MNARDALRRTRRLASYARYRASAKGRLRTQRYNAGPARRATNERYRATFKGIFAVMRSQANASIRRHRAYLAGIPPEELSEIAALLGPEYAGLVANVAAAQR